MLTILDEMKILNIYPETRNEGRDLVYVEIRANAVVEADVVEGWMYCRYREQKE